MIEAPDRDCAGCARLVGFREEIRERFADYFAAPVPSFGVDRARLLVVGLAPGLHGANRSGRPFTGDHAGILLYSTLHQFGFATRAESVAADDGLRLRNCRITNAVRCVPPQNKPLPVEVKACNAYLLAELESVPAGGVVLALGAIAHDAVLRALALRKADYRFAHGAEHDLAGRHTLLDSYHCSRYNTQTRRLTSDMFAQVFSRARELLS
ncbi:MAG: uracil-DNA glycosylase [Chromatiales bacterium]|nr:uracil-DNA glycosylase [Chromatiales bacterium]